MFLNLLKTASTVSLFTLMSKVTGLVRDSLMAGLFGASALTDAFNVAFRIPNLLRRLFAEGAFSQAFVPQLAATRVREGDEHTFGLIDAVATLLAWALLVTCVLGVVGAPILVWAIGAGLQKFDEAVVMTRIVFPYIACMSLVALSAGILNSWKRFVVPAATPVLLNLAWIAAALWLAPAFKRWGIEPIYAIAAGVMAGGVLQLAVQFPALARAVRMPRVGWRWAALKQAWNHPGAGTVLKNMAPALLGVSVAQVSLLINTQIATFVGVGAVSWLFYADRLMEFPVGLLGVALGVVLLPQLSAAKAAEDSARFSELIDWGLRLVLVLALPCAVALLVFPKALVSVLFHYKQFNANDVQQTVTALMGYGVGLMGMVSIKILAPGFYARQDIRTPVKIAVVVLIVTQLMNLVFVPWLGHAGLALSIGLGSIVNAAWLFFGLRAKGLYAPQPGWGAFIAKVALATAVLGGALAWAAHRIDWVGLQPQWLLRAGLLAAVLAGVALLYFGLLALLGLRPAQFMRRA
jgi:putative peptidoglycan lipid II flippase